jgi:hypothetical protein
MEKETAGTRPLRNDLEAVSRALQEVHKQILEAEGQFITGLQGLPLLDRLLHDPDWAWLRALSTLIADIDEGLAEDAEVSRDRAAEAASRVRALVFGLGEPRDEAFLDRYRPLLQSSVSLAGAHGALKRRIDALLPSRAH